jgi:hypothetical protein
LDISKGELALQVVIISKALILQNSLLHQSQSYLRVGEGIVCLGRFILGPVVLTFFVIGLLVSVVNYSNYCVRVERVV